MVTKKKTKFFKSLRFRILVILLILGIVPSAIVTQLMISNYEKQAIEVKVSEVSTQCAILCNQIIKENYLNDSSSQSVNSKLELLSNVYGGRMVIVDRDLKVKDWTDDQAAKIREIIGAEYKVEGDLRSEVQLNIKRLMDIGCYRGVRHRIGLPVRGQSTKNNARTRKGRKKTVANKKKATK